MVRRLFSDPTRPHPNRPQTSPPPYQATASAHSPFILTETTEIVTTEVVTTRTTTRLFSLPHWKRHSPPIPTSVAPGSSSDGKMHNVIKQRPSQYFYEKDLPPTPLDSESQASPLDSAEEISRESRRLSLFPSPRSLNASTSSGNPNSARSSTAVLAQAALGLGNAIARTPARSSRADINSVAFVPSTSSSTPHKQPLIRKAKSSAVLRGSHVENDRLPQHDIDESKRARGVSLGASHFFSTNNVEATGKVNESNNLTSPNKVVTRRASFWSRKKSVPNIDSLATENAPKPLEQLLIDPSSIDQPSIMLPSNHSGGLSRSRSERASPTQKNHITDEMIPQLPNKQSRLRKGLRRPSTADSLRRTENSRSVLFDREVPSPTTRRTPTTFVSDSTSGDASLSQMKPTRRPRAQTNPPLLHRLSLNIFSSTNSSFLQDDNSGPTSANPVYPSPRTSFQGSNVKIPKPLIDEEAPEGYLQRLSEAVSKSEIASILASSPDEFHARALRVYIGRFNFTRDPLDIALRRLLMHVGLPKETQQIDRVMESFASHYCQNNPGLFISNDHPYILAFSLIMLHTDAFNKSNKHKMTKVDYIKNTKLPGIFAEVLDCFYDNIVFVPFIFIEDPLDVNGQPGLPIDSPLRGPIAPSSSHSSNGNSLLGMSSNKVDPYYMISNNLLEPLRIDVENYVPLKDPYSYIGTDGPWNEDALQQAFARPSVIQVGPLEPTRPTSTFFNLSVGGPPSPFPPEVGSPMDSPSSGPIDSWTVTKYGILHRKDDVLDGGKKSSSRRWRSWSVLLTGSQLTFFRDTTWAITIHNHLQAPDSQSISPQYVPLKPDELISVKDAVAVYDHSYKRHEYTFRLAMSDGRQFLFQASDRDDMNEWIARINYASAFKSMGVRMRPVGMSGEDVHLTGVAAATSHLQKMRKHSQATPPKVKRWGNDSGESLSEADHDPLPARRVTLNLSTDIDVPIAPEVDGADQLKATFDQVKADLAAGRLANRSDQDVDSSVPLCHLEDDKLPSRSQIIRAKLSDLDSKVENTQSQVDSAMRFVHNLSILTPFQKSTRDRLITSLQGASNRIMQMRLELAKLLCHREVLTNDLLAEGRDWSRAKKLALQAATETIQTYRRGPIIPRMTLSFHDGEDRRSPSPDSVVPPSRPNSHGADSTSASFHSALDFGLDWSSSSNFGFHSDYNIFDSPQINVSSSSLQSFPFPESRLDDISRISPRTSEEIHERYVTAPEEAEEWDKTRAAQRVSLVRVPSSFTNRFGKRRDTMSRPTVSPP